MDTAGPLPVLTLVATRKELLAHDGEKLPKGSMGTIVVAMTRPDGSEDFYEVELVTDAGRVRRIFRATQNELDVLSMPASLSGR